MTFYSKYHPQPLYGNSKQSNISGNPIIEDTIHHKLESENLKSFYMYTAQYGHFCHHSESGYNEWSHWVNRYYLDYIHYNILKFSIGFQESVKDIGMFWALLLAPRYFFLHNGHLPYHGKHTTTPLKKQKNKNNKNPNKPRANYRKIESWNGHSLHTTGCQTC